MFKFLSKPLIIRRQAELIQRKCRRIIPKNSSTENQRLCEEEVRYYQSFKTTHVLLVVILILVVVAVILAAVFGVFKQKEVEKIVLIPPNPTKPLPLSPSTLHIYKKAAVCADGVPCAKIGETILKKNGSAVDATLAAMFCNGVYTMQSMGLGGGFLMTIYKKDEQKAYVLNAREKAPMNAKPEFYKEDRFLSQNGPLAVGVPGELRGYWAAHQRFGKLPWAEIIQPTIELCEQGYNMSKHQYTSLFAARLRNDSNFREWFYQPNSDKFKYIGSKIIPKKLCETLRVIAENGGDDLYNGTLSKLLLEDIKDLGGIITAEDLNNYTAEWQEPISVALKGQRRLYSVPPPGSGLLLGFILSILDGFNFTPNDIEDIPRTIETYHKIIEAFKYAYAKRTELGDMNFVNISDLITNLTSPKYAEEIRMKIKPNQTSDNPKDYGAVYYNVEDHGTAHISVLAQNGDAVSATSSVNIYFGAGMTSQRTGIILNSVIDDFSFPFFQNYFGLPGSPNNELKPGKRPLSSMSPSILITDKGDVEMVIGASGGTKITTAIAWVIMRTLWFQENIKEAVDAPRIHHQLYPMEIQYEYGILQQVVDGLMKIGHKTSRYQEAGSIICALLKKADKIFSNSDYRKGGEVFGIN